LISRFYYCRWFFWTTCSTWYFRWCYL